MSRQARAAAIVAALAGCAWFAAPARAATGDGWTAGYTLGLTRTQFSGTLGDSIPQGQYGFAFGLFLAYPLNRHVLLMPEALLAIKGGTFKEPVYQTFFIRRDTMLVDTTVYTGDARRTMDLTYLEFPLVVQLAMAPGRSFNPHVQLGVAPALRILGRFRSGNLYGNPPADPDDARRLDLGWIAGAGFNLRTRRAALRLDLRLTQGVVNVFDSGAPPGRNQAWSLTFGITP